MSDNHENTTALEGIRVLDLCDHRGEMAGRVLSDLGAEVICVEPVGGSSSRLRGPVSESGLSLWWATFALGKKSVVLDIASAKGREKFLNLIESADICLESFHPGYLGELGLDYGNLERHNPNLILASITPYGQDGPRAKDPSTDLTLEAAGGLVGLQGDPDRPPLPVGFPQASLHAGVQAAADVLIALNARDHVGHGQHLDVSTQSAVVWTLMNATGWPAVVGVNPPGFCDTRHLPRAMPVEGMTPPRLLECKDGYATFGTQLPGVGERTMAGTIKWMIEAHPDLVDAELAEIDWTHWMSQVTGGKLKVDAFNRAFDAVAHAFKRCTKAELLTLAVERKLLIAPILNALDILDDEHLKSRDFWQEVDGITLAGPFARLSKTPIKYRKPAPELGADQTLLEEPLRQQMPTPTAPKTATKARAKDNQSDSNQRRAFEGLKVADFAWVGVGPIISKAFADHGAEVIHIESSKRLDVLRTIGPFKDRQPGVNRSQFFNNFNTNKKSIDLDFTNPEDLSLAREVADWADVLVESFVPGTMAKYGLDYETLSKNNPELIMLSSCMRGQTGPHKKYGGFGNQGSALSGLFSVTGWPDRPPTGPWGAYTDFIAPRFGVSAIAAALLHRKNSGRGQHIDLAQIEAGIHFMGPLVAAAKESDSPVQNPGMSSSYCAPHGIYPAEDGRSFVAIAIETDIQWKSLVSLLECLDHKWNHSERQLHTTDIDKAIKAWVAKRSAPVAERELLNKGIPANEVLWPSQLPRDVQLKHRDFFKPLDHAETGLTNYDGHVTRFSVTQPELITPAPTLGEHSQKIRQQFKDLDN